MDEIKALEIEKRANDILHTYGYHSGNVIDYDSVIEIIIDILTQ